ncbi:YbaN family protein [Pleomorphomonas sp. NRK KF1]|uniref:YbaN family protein n=1 Tax=Pleomorphomonas sp. NRK KF1 TaxID=2943000 RepID=UPI00204478DD|nr:YbaN family protein [Pleomorphomonas sp. NRK KF1]MCM5554850.1 YbaN family protein [Pleomorphomonas sp. NRK KF1]
MRQAYLIIGCLMVVIGAIGVALPLLPTTPFLLIAAACFARSSPRLEAWLLSHRRFGPLLAAWRERGAIPRSGKLLSTVGMALGFYAFYKGSQPGLMLMAIVASTFVLIGIYVWSRPE